MNCSLCQEMFAAHIERLLDEKLSRQIEAHVADCSPCLAELKETQQLFNRLVKDGHRAAVTSIGSEVMDRILRRQARQSKGRTLPTLAAKVGVAACLVVGVAIVLLQPFSSPSRMVAHAKEFAAATRQIEKAKTITWKTTFYNEVVSGDGKRTWIETDTRERAYRAPGLYRDADRDANGQISFVTITDNVGLKQIQLNHTKQEATLREMAIAVDDANGPFQWLAVPSGGVTQWVTTKKIGNREVNVFRHIRKDVDVSFRFEHGKRDWSTEYWIDAKTKRLVRVQVPGLDVYDPEKDAKRQNPSEEKWSTKVGLCWIQHDIMFDAELDESLFKLDPPAGYTLKREGRPQVTEEEMIEYLGMLAEYFNNTFPEKVLPRALTSSEINRLYDKPEKERSAAEKKYLEKDRYYKMANLNLFPIRHFLQDRAVDDTWRYLGKGVKLSEKERIVCWYRLKGATKYRVVYGDLSVRDVEADDLPLPVER